MSIKQGDKVSVNYEGKFDSGEIFDSSFHGDHSHPIEFVVGEHQVIKGFEDAVVGMNVGEEKEIVIEAGDAYGERNEELVKEFDRKDIPLNEEPEVGMVLGFNLPQGGQFPATIAKITEDKITFDLNHPLAGKRLNFKIKVADVKN
jgi:FKBP-type peptidyl-prolyl cis-trans isomerase 2